MKKAFRLLLLGAWLSALLVYVYHVKTSPLSPLKPGEVALDYHGERVLARPLGSSDTVDLVVEGATSALVFGRTTCQVCTSRMDELIGLLSRIRADTRAFVLLDPPDLASAYETRGAAESGLLMTAVEQDLAQELAIGHVPTLAVFAGGALAYSWAGVPGRTQVREANRILGEF